MAGPEGGTINVDNDKFEKHISDILQGLLDIGFRRILWLFIISLKRDN